MITEQIRATVFGHFKTYFGAATLEYENLQTIDMSTRSDPFVDLSLRFLGNEQVSLGENPLSRQFGALQADIYVKEGKGSRAAYIIGDAVHALVSRKSILGVEFQTPKTLTPITHSGWYRLTVRCPFYMDY